MILFLRVGTWSNINPSLGAVTVGFPKLYSGTVSPSKLEHFRRCRLYGGQIKFSRMRKMRQFNDIMKIYLRML